MNKYEKIAEGMRLMREGCNSMDYCEDCPFYHYCETKTVPYKWVEKHEDDDEEEPEYDCDWGYNEDEGFDAYEGCYTWDC